MKNRYTENYVLFVESLFNLCVRSKLFSYTICQFLLQFHVYIRLGSGRNTYNSNTDVHARLKQFS